MSLHPIFFYHSQQFKMMKKADYGCGPVSNRLRFVKEYDEKLGTRRWRAYRLPATIKPTALLSDAGREGRKASGVDLVEPAGLARHQEPEILTLFGVKIPIYQNEGVAADQEGGAASDADQKRRNESGSGGDSLKLFGVDIPIYQNEEQGKGSRKRNPNHKSDGCVPKKPRRLRVACSKHPYYYYY